MDRGDRSEANTPAPPYAWVNTAEGFQAMLSRLAGASRLAIDMEADSLYHYFEKVCLIQLSTDSATFVLDALAVRDIRSLGPLMSDTGVQKVLHAAAYDVMSLRRDYGFCFANLFDTHIAAQLLGHEQLGLDALLEQLLGVVHSKRCQRDDWSKRPLEAEQLEYAAMDTHHLLSLRDVLEGHLRLRGRLSWAQEEFRAAAETPLSEKQFDPDGYLRIKGSRELTPRELSVLRAIYLLRDKYARVMDLPPFKVVNNSVLVDLARNQLASPGDLFKRRGISFRVARNFSGEIYRTVVKARSEDAPALLRSARSDYRAMTRAARDRLSRLKAWRQSKARELGLSVGVVFPGNLLEALAAEPPPDVSSLGTMDGMRQWRAHEFGAEILRVLRSE
jgi:ribonuclease D